MSRRGVIALVIVVLWAGGLAALIRREYFQPDVERLAEAATRVTPGAEFYAVMDGARQVGFASSTIDTVAGGITSSDYLVADVPHDGGTRRIQARTTIEVSRALHVRTFDVSVESDSAPMHAGGRVEGDSVIVFAMVSGRDSTPADSQRIRIAGPVLLPALVPLAVALGEAPKVGKSYVLPVFDPRAGAQQDTRITVAAETTFVVNDSSVLDSTTRRWRGVTPDTLKAWRLSAPGPAELSGWVDPQGRLVEGERLGYRLQRRPYEVAYENWRLNSAADTGGPARADRGVEEATAVAAGVAPLQTLRVLRVRITGAGQRALDLAGGAQVLRGDTLTVTQVDAGSLPSRFFTGVPRPPEAQAALRPEPLVESTDRGIRALASRLADGSHDPRVVATRIMRWVHDSVGRRATLGIPDAVRVLRARSGDGADHAQLYLALARAAGIPARGASGLLHVDRTFYYHAWAEVFLGQWVPVDPTFGQFPADAAHVRFTAGPLMRQSDLAARVGSVQVQVLPPDPSRGTP